MTASAGGQHNEIGGEYRARLGALLATAVLLGDDLGQPRRPRKRGRRQPPGGGRPARG